MIMRPRPSASPEGATHPDRAGSRGQIGRRRWFSALVIVPLIVYCGVVVIFAAIQTRLIFPGSQTQGDPEAVVQAPPRAALVLLSSSRGDRIVALFGAALHPDSSPRADARTRPTLLYFYGNGMSLRDASDQFDRFRRWGFNVLIPEYVGYGMSGGQPGETGCRETAEAALAYLKSRPEVDQGRIVVVGWSLGGAVALDLATRHRVAGVATFCTFTSMSNLAREFLPLLPGSLLLRHRFENLAKIPKVGCPVLIGHGRADQIIPVAMADRLAAAATGPVSRIMIEEAGHNDFFQTGGARVEVPFQQFVAQLPQRP